METLTTLAEPTHSVLDSPNSPSPGSPPNDANPSSTPTPDPPSTPAAAIDLEPDEAWKGWLRFRIERSMKSVVERVRDEYESRLATLTTTSSPSGTGSKPSASQLSAARDEYDAAMADIIRLAQTHFDRALERERQERRWAAGAEVDAEWQAQMIAEHQAIADLIEREKRQLTQQKEHRGGSGTGRGQSQYQTIAGQQPPPRLLAIRPPEAVPWFRGDNVSSVSSDGSSSSGSYGGTRRRPRQFPNDFGPGRHL
ncbi:hypothetical protein PUNSTDRAFT_52513, partial [Punctularia strigosozonata HHB-11173 SS5]|uniref:uncharacterized protein n=1 Tax=Punctularia strigosozonata (strain HHB-11173) TaxID=741275 RepID=UPI0004416D4C